MALSEVAHVNEYAHNNKEANESKDAHEKQRTETHMQGVRNWDILYGRVEGTCTR